MAGAYVARAAPLPTFWWHSVLDAIMYRDIPQKCWEGFDYYWQQRGCEARAAYKALPVRTTEDLTQLRKAFLDHLFDTEKDEVERPLSAYLRQLGLEANVFQEFRTNYTHPRFHPEGFLKQEFMEHEID